MKKIPSQHLFSSVAKMKIKGNYRFEKDLMNLLFVCSRGAVINYNNYIITWLLSLVTILLVKSLRTANVSLTLTSLLLVLFLCTYKHSDYKFKGMTTTVFLGICTIQGCFLVILCSFTRCNNNIMSLL